MKLVRTLPLLVFAGLLGRGAAQTFDSSGDGLLNGQYYFRHVFYVSNSSGNSNAVALYGIITFDGKGNYTISGQKVEQTTGSTPVSYTPAGGTYTISASGMGFLENSLYTGDRVYGLVSNGIFVGSSTETSQPYSDLFIAAQLGSPEPTNKTLFGIYTVSYADPWILADDAEFQFTSDGSGKLGTVSAAGWGLNSGQAFQITKSYSGVNYNFSNGGAYVTFGGDGKTLLPTAVLLYISPDGSFIFGGAPNGFDMFVGVRVPSTSGTPAFNGLYYGGGLNFDGSTFHTFYGALDPVSNNVIEHRRITGADYTFADPYTLNPDGTYDDVYTSQHYFFGLNGAIRIGWGTSESTSSSPLLGFSVAIQAPAFSAPGVYLNPTGVVNAASSAPFTAGLSPGELITLYGTGLAPSSGAAQSIPLPTSLNGVSVQINGVAAPLLYVSATQVSVVVPYETETSSTVVNIQVMNNGVASNMVSEFLSLTSPGIFTSNPEGGIGQAAALHTDYSLISPSSPAQIGETIQVFLTGLGTVSPAIADGAAGAATAPLNQTTGQINAYIGGIQATAPLPYTGLAPNFAGLYQVNLKVPSGVASGQNYLEIAGPDADTSEALIQIGTPASAAAQLAASARSRRLLRPSGRPGGFLGPLPGQNFH